MAELILSDPFVTALIFICFIAVIKVTYAYHAGKENIDRFWRAVGGTGCSMITLILTAHVLITYSHSGLTVALALITSLCVHMYINWTIGLWRDRRDRHYPYAFRTLRDGKGVHFYRLLDAVSHIVIVIWVYYIVVWAAPP